MGRQAVNNYPLQEIRDDYASLHHLTYLNTGTVGLMSESVLARHLENLAAYERAGHVGEPDARAGYERARTSFAKLINADPDEIALNRNASDGVNYVLAGLDLPDSAGLLTTDQEHPAVLLPMTLASRQTNSDIHMLEIVDDDEAMLAQLRELLSTNRIHLAVISHVSCESGQRLPIAEICRICREHGVLTLVDGAQSVAQFPVDVRDIGCDFMTGNGHKWLCGPKGTGFVYIRRDRTNLLTPPYAGDGSVDPRFDRTKFLKDAIVNEWGFRADAQRFEFGTRNWHLYGAVEDAVDQLAGIGWTAIQQHVAEISTELKSDLAERPGISLHTPMSWERSCGIVSFSADGWDGVELSERLWQDHQIIQRRVQIPSGVRISCAHYTSREDIQRFLSALDELMQPVRRKP